MFFAGCVRVFLTPCTGLITSWGEGFTRFHFRASRHVDSYFGALPFGVCVWFVAPSDPYGESFLLSFLSFGVGNSACALVDVVKDSLFLLTGTSGAMVLGRFA